MTDPTVTPDPMDEAAARCAARAADDRDLLASVEDDLLQATGAAAARQPAKRYTVSDVERIRDEAVAAERERIRQQIARRLRPLESRERSQTDEGARIGLISVLHDIDSAPPAGQAAAPDDTLAARRWDAAQQAGAFTAEVDPELEAIAYRVLADNDKEADR